MANREQKKKKRIKFFPESDSLRNKFQETNNGSNGKQTANVAAKSGDQPIERTEGNEREEKIGWTSITESVVRYYSGVARTHERNFYIIQQAGSRESSLAFARKEVER